MLVDFTVPIYTAIGQLTSFTLGYKPQLVVSNVGIDPTTVGGLLKTISKGKASGTALIEGAITDGYLPSPTDTSNPWIQLFMKVHEQYDASAPFDGNVEYGMATAYTLVQALQAAGKNLTRQGLIDAINQHGASWMGPGLVPFRYSTSDHGGYSGAEMGMIKNGKIVLSGRAAHDHAGRGFGRSLRTRGPSPLLRRTGIPGGLSWEPTSAALAPFAWAADERDWARGPPTRAPQPSPTSWAVGRAPPRTVIPHAADVVARSRS